MPGSIRAPGGGALHSWLKRPGEWVIPGEPVALVQGESGLWPATAYAGGLLTAVLVPAGQTVEPGDQLGLVEEAFPMVGAHWMVPWNPVRQAIARHMAYTHATTAHVSTFVEVDMSATLALKQELRAQGIRVPLTPFFIRATADALRDFPLLNAEVTPAGLLLKGYIHVAFATATPYGALLPVIFHADQKNLLQIAAEVVILSERARSGLWRPEEGLGATFTITNPGAFGSVWSTPLISQPNVGILDFEAVVPRPVAVEGRVEIRPVMYAGLTADHRVIDGAVGVRFLRRVKEVLETARFGSQPA